VTACSSTVQDQAYVSDQFTLGPGYYRPVFTGGASLRFTNGGVSELSIQVQPAAGGLAVSEFSKSVSNSGSAEQTFAYIYLLEPTNLAAVTRVSTNCGLAWLSGGLHFERVSD
jgi:hypothetical protein